VAERLETGIAVVGAGPAGIAAACRAAEAGARVVLIDEAPVAGGQVWRHRPASPPPRAARPWLERLAACGAGRLTGSVVDAEGAHSLHVAEDERLVRVECERVVLATGARERFLPFPGWTLPNVLGVGGAQALLKAGASFRGRRVVIAGSGPLLLPVAASLARAGARVGLVAEQAPWPAVARFASRLLLRPAKLLQAIGYRSRFATTRYRCGVWLTAARGAAQVEAAELTDGRRRWTLDCDVLAAGFGLVANLELPVLLGCRVAAGGVVVHDDQATSVTDAFCAGEPTGIGGVDLALLEGQIAGLAAAGRSSEAKALAPRRDRERAFARDLAEAFALRPELRRLPAAETLVCRCEDVALGRLRPEWSARQAKLYTRAGMGPCQGRVCGPALEFLFGWERDSVRPPLMPLALSDLEARR